MPILHRSRNKAAEKGGEIAGKQPSINRRLIAVEEEDKEEHLDQALYLNHQNSEQVLNENIIVIHPLIDVAVDQHKDFSRCMESKEKDHKR